VLNALNLLKILKLNIFFQMDISRYYTKFVFKRILFPPSAANAYIHIHGRLSCYQNSYFLLLHQD